MKVIIQIPCFNEAETLGLTVGALPGRIQGFESVEYLVINDGSTDATAEVARQNGVHHIVNIPGRQGLARAYMVGLEESVRLGADVIVSTDGDNQYNADDIEKLIRPVLQKKADMSIGVRPIAQIEHFSLRKKILHGLGSWIVRKMSKLDISDSPSGFRALSRDAALRLNVFTHFSYTLETVLQATQKGLTVVDVPIRVNPDLRPSRLMSSLVNYVVQSIITLLRVAAIYQPFFLFFRICIFSFLMGLFVFCIYLYRLFIGQIQGRVELLIFVSVFWCIGLQTFVIACLADLLAAKRKVLEDIQYKVKSQYFSK